jgi:hypothetical protein
VVQGSQAEMDALVALQVCVGGRGGGVEILDKGLEGSGRGEGEGGERGRRGGGGSACVPVCLCTCVPVCLCACVPVCLCACVPVPRPPAWAQLHQCQLPQLVKCQ